MIIADVLNFPGLRLDDGTDRVAREFSNVAEGFNKFVEQVNDNDTDAVAVKKSDLNILIKYSVMILNVKARILDYLLCNRCRRTFSIKTGRYL